jgi:hypothetical protein
MPKNTLRTVNSSREVTPRSSRSCIDQEGALDVGADNESRGKWEADPLKFDTVRILNEWLSRKIVGCCRGVVEQPGKNKSIVKGRALIAETVNDFTVCHLCNIHRISATRQY